MNIFRNSFIDVVEKTICITPEESLLALKEGYISSIEILESGIVIYIVTNKDFLRLLSIKLLAEDNPDEETLEDLSKEFTNLITGRAKVLLQEKGRSFTISTPTFYHDKIMENYNNGVHFHIDDAHCSIFMRGA
ncbi:chemotaxis protein CheX [Helicobacter anseris]|uniref:Chemotaxis protein CheX n=1 Tax=Helicobacter anseris TaxID=375926 RepID=A0A3D8JBM2_9HELI|nr:chemotaxis protein CheX [Helicobacter anseris]RDU74291.1 chemotaxis protein CheX [Helicobacter anseris]